MPAINQENEASTILAKSTAAINPSVYSNGWPHSVGFKIAAATFPERHDAVPGFLHRVLIRFGGALQRGILGKSAHEYMKQFSGSDEYWKRTIAAQQGWPEKQLSKREESR